MLQLGTVQLASRTLILNNHKIQLAIRDGLGITSPNAWQLFELDQDGSLPDVNNFLRDRMPQLFTHFAKPYPWVTTINNSSWQDSEYIWPYMLLARSGRTLVPTILNGHVDLTVSDLCDNSGLSGISSFQTISSLTFQNARLFSHEHSSPT